MTTRSRPSLKQKIYILLFKYKFAIKKRGPKAPAQLLYNKELNLPLLITTLDFYIIDVPTLITCIQIRSDSETKLYCLTGKLVHIHN